MMKYDLLLCNKSFFNFFRATTRIYQMDRETRNAFDTISQHRLVYSDRLLDQYKKYARENNLLGDFEMVNTWLSSMFYCSSNNDQYMYILDDSDPSNIDDAICSASQDENIFYPLVLCDVCAECGRFAKRMDPIKLFPSDKINGQSVNNRILRNTVPFSVETKKDESIKPYVEWFSELLKGEKTVTIFNRYALKNNEFPSEKKFVLDQVEPGTSVTIYADNESAEITDDEVDQTIKELEAIAENKKIHISLYSHYFRLFRCKSYHDRRIFMNNIRIKLTGGFDSLYRSRSGTKIEGTGLEVGVAECDSEKAISDLLEEYKGYTLVWKSN